MLEKHDVVIAELQKLIIRLASVRADAISEEYKEIYAQIHIKPKDIEAPHARCPSPCARCISCRHLRDTFSPCARCLQGEARCCA